MKTRRYETAIASEPQSRDGMLDHAKAAIIGAPSLAIVIVALSLIVVNHIWWQGTLFAFMLPFLALSVRMMAYLTGSPRDRLPVGEKVRLIPMYGRRLVDGIDRRDLIEFICTICRTGNFTQKEWRGRRLPSGATCSNEVHAKMVQELVRFGFVEGRSEGAAGHLTTHNANEILKKLELTEPN